METGLAMIEQTCSRCQAKEEKLQATMNNLVAERQLGQEKLEHLETVTQLLWNKEKELEDMSQLCQAKEGQLVEIFKVYNATAENLAAERQLGEERLDVSAKKLEAMTQLCQAKDKELEDVAELCRMLETVLQRKIKQAESQQCVMEHLIDNRPEGVAYVIRELADLRKPPSPTPTPGCPTVQETLPVERELQHPSGYLKLASLVDGYKIHSNSQQAM
ncbi:hypothetical protein SKAU_G00231450 [Synaphobranchus kaupii]|uniref:Uncharacterized protein n=1 Tax=Synaphobranchus kaupii TaxID=118154 RepID=A0A9Q1ITA8_SYNKA|nr:hypothetical protein SKAU_G00231450 [Synaphobranchus kaupii]